MLELINDAQVKTKSMPFRVCLTGNLYLLFNCSIAVPDIDKPGFINVIALIDGIDQNSSATIMEICALGPETSCKITEGLGISHEDYKNWVKEKEDILKIEVTVVLRDNSPDADAGWSRFCIFTIQLSV